MARPTTNSADWFQHFVGGCPEEAKVLYILEERFGNDGYAAWYKLKELLVGTEGHCIDTRDPDDMWMYITARLKLDELQAKKILDLLAKLKAIDSPLWEEGRIWSQMVVDSLCKLYATRKRDPPCKPPLKDPLFENNVGALSFLPKKTGT